MKSLLFKEEKITQIASLIIKLHQGSIEYSKLIKLLYIVDRSALLKWGSPSTYDDYILTKCGFVLTNTLDIIEGRLESKDFWNVYISEPDCYEVKLLQTCPTSQLSKAEVDLIEEVFREYGYKSNLALTEEHYKFPEWRDFQGSPLQITYRDILKAEGKLEEEIKDIEEELEHLEFVHQLFS